MDFDEVLAIIVGGLVGFIIIILTILIMKTPSKMTNENCIYYEKEIYCKEVK